MINTINTHEKLFQTITDMNHMYDFFKEKGFRGDKEDLLECLLWGLKETDAYTYYPKFLSTDEDITEDKYFEMLVEKMNGII